MRRDWRRCLMAAGLFVAAARAEAPPSFAVAYPLAIEPGAKAYVLELPQDAYAWATLDAGLADVVVVDGQGRQVTAGPYVAAPPGWHPVTLDAPLLPVPSTADGIAGPRIQRSTTGDIIIEPGAAPADGAPHEWLIDARQPVAPERLEFAPFPREASLGIDIDSSHNLQDWTPLVRDASVVMLGKGDDAVDVRVVKLAGSPARYYRVRVSRGDAPWGTSATTVTLSGNVEDATSKDVAKRRWFVVAPTDTRSSGQGVDYDYRLPAALPVSALRVKLGKSDSVARFDAIAVEGEMSGEQLGTLVVTPGADTEASPSLSVPAARRDLLRLHSATPLREAPQLSVGWRPDRIVFLPEGQGPYRLLVGSRSARRLAWPIADAMTALRTDGGPAWRPAPATVGEAKELEGRKAVEGTTPFDWTRPLLWIVLLLGAALVAGMAASLLRKPRPGAE